MIADSCIFQPTVSMPASRMPKRHSLAGIEQQGSDIEDDDDYDVGLDDELNLRALDRYYTLLAENEQQLRE